MSLIFISYSRKDAGVVEQHIELLRSFYKPSNVWYDQDILAGKKWEDVIEVEIRKCRFFLPMLSPSYLNSPVCRQELEWAKKYNKVIIPLCISPDFSIPSDLSELKLSDINCKNNINEVVQAINIYFRPLWKVDLNNKRNRVALLFTVIVLLLSILGVSKTVECLAPDNTITQSHIDTFLQPFNKNRDTLVSYERTIEDAYENCARGSFDPAFRALNDVLNKEPDNLYALFIRATCYDWRSGKPPNRCDTSAIRADEDRAISEYDKVLKTTEQEQDLYLIERANFNRGYLLFERFVSQDVQSSMSIAILEHFDTVIESYETTQNEAIKDLAADAYYFKGRVYQVLCNKTEADAMFEKSREYTSSEVRYRYSTDRINEITNCSEVY